MAERAVSDVTTRLYGLSVTPLFHCWNRYPAAGVALMTAVGDWHVGWVSTVTLPIASSADVALKLNPAASTKLEK